MTNREAWNTLTAGLPAALLYKEAGWWFLNCATLGRNVSLGHTLNVVYPMQYMLFVGPAGGGKSTIQDAIKLLMDGHKQDARASTIDVNTAGIMREEKTIRNWYTFSPDSTSFEALVAQANNSTSSATGKKGETIISARYMIFLDEFTSICSDPISTQHVNEFLLTTWSGKSWSRNTHKHGLQELRAPALNMMACTTPDSLLRVAKHSPIVTSGFAARTLFIYAPTPAFLHPWPSQFTDKEHEAIKQLRAHVARLAGHVHALEVAPDAFEYLNTYARVCSAADYKRKNPSQLLNDYYTRRYLHIKKLAIGHHYSEGINDEPLSVADLKAAISFLDRIEPHMHKPFTGYEYGNEYASISDKLLHILESGPKKITEIQRLLWLDAAPDTVTSLIGHMMTLGLIEPGMEGYRKL